MVVVENWCQIKHNINLIVQTVFALLKVGVLEIDFALFPLRVVVVAGVRGRDVIGE